MLNEEKTKKKRNKENQIHVAPKVKLVSIVKWIYWRKFVRFDWF